MDKNIILIFADQMHKYALGRVSEDAITPNLDRLCDRGVLFENGYSNNPVCTPFRGVLFSGQYSSTCNVTRNEDPLPTNIPCMADAFNNRGYETSFIGKWHLGGRGNCMIPEELRGGFKHFFGYQCHNGFKKGVCFYDELNREYSYDIHRETVVTNYAVQQLKQFAAGDKPFLQVIGYQAPHYPEQPSDEYYEMYRDRTIARTPDFIEIDPYVPTYNPFSPRPIELCPDYQRYGNNMDEYLKLYYAMVTEIDAGIGRIMDELERLGLSENTIVVFTSDHGDMQGSHGFKNKCLPQERSCGVPFIISDPSGTKGERCQIPVSGVDLYPTLLDYAGYEREPHLHGQSLMPLLREEPFTPVPMFAENYNNALVNKYGEKTNWVMVVDGPLKLVYDIKRKEPCMLYNMQDDPYEMNNLIDDSAMLGKVEYLTGLILQNANLRIPQ